MAALGDFDLSTVVYGKFTTFRPSTGAAFTLGGVPVLSVYKDNSVTQSTTGVTLTADFDSVTGLNHFAIDTSTDGTFYSAGSFFDIVITTGTVDSISVVGAVVASFTIRKNSALKPTTAGRALDVSAGGEAGVDWANVGSPTTALALTGTTIAVTQKVDVDTIKTNPVVNGGTVTFPTTATLASTTNITAGTVTTATNVTTVNGLAAGVITATSIAADAITDAKVASDVTIASVTGAVGSVTGAVGSVTGNVGGNVVGSVASVTARVTANTDQLAGQTVTAAAGVTFPTSVASPTNITAGTITTATNLTNAPTAGDFTATMKTSIGTAVAASAVASVTGNVGGNVTGSVGSVTGLTASDVGLIKVVTDKIATMLADAGISPTEYQFKTVALANGPSGSGPSAATIADAVWDELIAGHLGAGSTGESLSNAGSAGNPWSTVIEGSYTAEDILRIVVAVLAGKTTISGTTATFRDITDASNIVVASMSGSQRATVTLNP
jgi:hypothetical protein